jgi:pimeloyl-ACP methyl ester carboxylesterase
MTRRRKALLDRASPWDEQDGRTADMARPRLSLRRASLVALAAVIAVVAGWTWWAERHPQDDRRLRVLVHDQLHDWFPDLMAPDDGWHGLHRQATGDTAALQVVLIHGLDEPGGIWDDLLPALTAAGYAVWEFRYPNDQGVDRSAEYLAKHWPTLDPSRPVALIGHSMGGLVAREFVSRWRHPVDTQPLVDGAPVAGVVLAGTPNHGSEWARLRIWLELRDQFASLAERRFSLFAALRDGTGEAKIDLRPESDFLRALNARPWPESVPVLLIAGQLLSPNGSLSAGLDAASAEVGSPQLGLQLHAWWSSLGAQVGDGVVSLESIQLPDMPSPIILEASHRGMLHRLYPSDPEPPAIAPILAALRQWNKVVVDHAAYPDARSDRRIAHTLPL